MANGEMVEIEKRLERMHLALKRQEKERERKDGQIKSVSNYKDGKLIVTE